MSCNSASRYGSLRVPRSTSRTVPQIQSDACPSSPSVPHSTSRPVPKHAVPQCPPVRVPERPSLHESVPLCPSVPECPAVRVPGCPAKSGTRRLPVTKSRDSQFDSGGAAQALNAGRRGVIDHALGCILVPFGANSAFMSFSTPRHPQYFGSTLWHSEAGAKKRARGSHPILKRRPTRYKMLNLGPKSIISLSKRYALTHCSDNM